jgi:alkylation response protein AidB-like acyl-CoA dehydrogenase
MTAPTEEQESLRQSVRRLLTKRSSSAAVRSAMQSEPGYDAALWQRMCEQIGVAALAIPEQYGGAGASLAEAHVVLDELGRTLTPAPMLGSAVLAAQLVLALGDDEASARLLPTLADGTSLGAVCWAGSDGRWSIEAAPVSATDGDLIGEAHYVLDGDLADVLLVVTNSADGLSVYELDPAEPGVTRTHTAALDPTRRLATVSLDRARGRRVGGAAGPALTQLRDIAATALSAEQVGAAARILELTVEYSKLRVQFGRPIGSFQALKHRMADLHVLVEAARSASYAAVAGTVDPAVAKAYCSEAFCTVAGEAIQLHGGIAITWEHDAHLYFKRAHGSAQLFGQPAEHVARMADLAGLTGPAEMEDR